jgi:hypothetical protein
MKINIFIQKENLVYKTIGLVGGVQDGGLEDVLINGIDEQKMTAEKIYARRFLDFLGNRRLTLQKLSELPKIEQNRLRTEFFEN